MGRDLATIRATFNGKPMLIMTSHLESEKQSSDERKAQFHQVYSVVGHAPSQMHVAWWSFFQDSYTVPSLLLEKSFAGK